MAKKDFDETTISFLSVGTKILLKDVMDQYIRTLGDYKTHYAFNMSSAQRAFSESSVNVMITEVDLIDGSAFRLIQSVGGVMSEDDLYVVLALEERSPALLTLAAEIEAHDVLIKPFSTSDVLELIKRYKNWKTAPKQAWENLLREGTYAAREKKFREAENKFLEAIKQSPGNPVPMYKVGMYYVNKPDHAMAEKLLKKAIELKPDYVQAISALGSLYLAKHDLEKAEVCLRKAQTLSPLNPDRFAELVKLNLERCADLCKSAVRLDPSNVKARFHLGRVLVLQKDYVTAVRELERLLPILSDEMKTEAQTYIALSKKLGALRSG